MNQILSGNTKNIPYRIELNTFSINSDTVISLVNGKVRKTDYGTMNQILEPHAGDYLYETYKKKLIYKLQFLSLSIVLIAFIGAFFYVENIKTSSESESNYLLTEFDSLQNEISMQETISQSLQEIPQPQPQEIGDIETPLIVSSSQHEQLLSQPQDNHPLTIDDCVIIGTIQIPKIKLSYPILSETNDRALRLSLTKFWGPNPNEKGNLCIAGHNFKNNKFLSNIHKLKKGDSVFITDLYGKTIEYVIYDKFEVSPEDTSCTNQITNGKREITLITCNDAMTKRIIVKALEKK